MEPDALTIPALLAGWDLTLAGDPYTGGHTAVVVPVTRRRSGEPLVLKVGRRHFEAEHEADGLRAWDGDGAVRCHDALSAEDRSALLLERCDPGTQLGAHATEPEQDEVIAGLLLRLWGRRPAPGHPFRPLHTMCDAWAASVDRDADEAQDPAQARHAAAMLHELARSATDEVLLATDLHAGNVLAAGREPWLAIDPKPYLGDPAYDVVQHMLNCERLGEDPVGLAGRMARLLDLDPGRVESWLFARCVQEARNCPALRGVVRLLSH